MRVLTLGLLVAVGACGEDPPFPADYQDTWLEALSCSEGSVHGGAHVRIHVNDTAKPTWEDWAQRVAASGSGVLPAGEMIAFEPGSVLLKAQYTDAGCSTLTKWTMMTRLETGADTANGNWRFENVLMGEEGEPAQPTAGNAGCFGCHQNYRRYDYAGNSPNPPQVP